MALGGFSLSWKGGSGGTAPEVHEAETENSPGQAGRDVPFCALGYQP